MPSSHAAQLVLCASLLGWLALRARLPRLARPVAWALPVLGILALVAHLDFFRPHFARGPVHYWEFYHYHLGTKYFGELGYGGLYEASVVADAEDDPAHFEPDAIIRSLADYRGMFRRQVLERAGAIKGAFSPERWEAFKRDVAVYRAAGGAVWRSSRVQQDHGYNGSPLVTALLGTLANQPWLSTRTFLLVLSWSDLALMLGVAALVGSRLGAEHGWLLLFLWGANPLNAHAYVGGAYLRTLHLACLALALVAFHHRRNRSAGAMLAAAALLRVYPSFIAAALLARDLLSADRVRRLARHWQLYRWLGGAVLVLVGATIVVVSSPSGRSAWSEFADKMILHGRLPSINVIGLEYPFLYSLQHDAAAARDAWRAGRRVDWAEEARRTLQDRRVAHTLAVAATLLVLGAVLRGASDGEAMLGGLAVTFAMLHLSSYDWAVLALVPLMLPRDRAAPAELALLFATLAGVQMIPVVAGVSDRKYMVMSLLVGAYLAWALLSRFWRRSRAPAISAPG